MKIDLDDYESLQIFSTRPHFPPALLMRLKEQGITQGNTVSIYDLEFDYGALRAIPIPTISAR
jgi:hypothetical protein